MLEVHVVLKNVFKFRTTSLYKFLRCIILKASLLFKLIIRRKIIV